MAERNPQDQDKYVVRFPEGMRDRIKTAAEMSGRSMNSEIVQRLAWSFETPAETLRLDLPSDLWNALMADAAINDRQMDERAIQILAAAYDETSEYTTTLSKVLEMAQENTDLSERLEQLKEKQDVDFLLYYAKVVQLGQFTSSILSVDNIPAEIRETARQLGDLAGAEAATLKRRHEEALFKYKLANHSRDLDREVAENDGRATSPRSDRE
ncbi:Arc family DNA-binding protein [Rhizobium beringeri]|uniref:Arc family DNA-binding protein n=1 Tax=Rhizobium beringeri TaxID=3019934 RepID=UPI002E0E7F1C|nr:Arc family DNA-binding protein [Rhizobium beringeri]